MYILVTITISPSIIKNIEYYIANGKFDTTIISSSLVYLMVNIWVLLIIYFSLGSAADICKLGMVAVTDMLIRTSPNSRYKQPLPCYRLS